MSKKILFLTGTRADFGKMHPLMNKVEVSDQFECHVFITGMHMLSKYGSTYKEVEKKGYKNIYKYINQTDDNKMDIILSNTILGLSNYVQELKPDLIVVHGDRLEALAGAIVGALNNILVAHVEGGEISGTIDELMRHSITKLAHLHLVANEEAKKRVIQLGEKKENIFIIGSPDIDIMMNEDLPSLCETKSRYDLDFDNYAILLYHPVTTKLDSLSQNVEELIDAIVESKKNYIVVYPNNDEGSDIVINQYNNLNNKENFKLFPSIRFEHFLTLLRNASFIIGNSSAGVREAEIYGIPSINIGTRQNKRNNSDKIINVEHKRKEILKAINEVKNLSFEPEFKFGDGKSSEKFFEIINNNKIWNISAQKTFVDINNFY